MSKAKKATIACYNNKGGVGKTTLSIHLAGGLAYRGYKCLVIDLDSQNNVATSLLQDMSGIDVTSYNFLQNFELIPFSDLPNYFYKYPISFWDDLGTEGQFHFMPSGGDSSVKSLYSKDYAINHFKPAFEMLHNYFDIIILDCPAEKELMKYIIGSSTHILIPTQLEALPVNGVYDFINLYEAIFKMYPKCADILGIVPTMTLKQKTHFELARVLSNLKDPKHIDNFIPVLPAIRHLAAIKEGSLGKQLVYEGFKMFSYKKDENDNPVYNACDDFMAVVDYVNEKLERSL